MDNLTDTQKAELEAIIRKAVPSSMKLKAGCIVISKTSHNNKPTTVTWVSDRQILLGRSERGRDKFERDYKILGRPLTSLDVLIALDKEHPFQYAINSNGWLYKIGKDGRYEGVEIDRLHLDQDYHWNIENNPEFGLFLYLILMNNND